MKVKRKNLLLNDCTIEDTTRKSIDRTLTSEINSMCNVLISEGLAQHRDEARILIANALENHAVQEEIIRITKHRIDHGHIGFGGYEDSPFYRNVNFD
ncbi:hypothetical protein JUJ52_03165 [Virgibacillus sp. AGTR]|uniref:hypothetical protein n=1 Tax=Virgibacillus sp. AGTR TaxID=2812055 RepID=UPI001D16DD77|nr:hypothetical protein [Virgibacillus sp. AGTR]MCC2248958.1 hypothetical protein [Virgibacillus sp. AGTR]